MESKTSILTILFILTILPEFSASGQEVLNASKIQARGVRKNLPELGLPERIGVEIDPVIWYKDGLWHGADSLKATPFWTTETIGTESVVKSKIPSEIIDFCKGWGKTRRTGSCGYRTSTRYAVYCCMYPGTKQFKLEINRFHYS